jgi:hypothetical protein
MAMSWLESDRDRTALAIDLDVFDLGDELRRPLDRHIEDRFSDLGRRLGRAGISAVAPCTLVELFGCGLAESDVLVQRRVHRKIAGEI